ncbi:MULTISPECIES: hypothetical protein [unclassified Microcoleus]|uniref:hypothetical protein n=1 Tax=unclassified Microcoleus TaxID=2642155 RepID=UPI0025EDABFE|nr:MULTISPECIES: hypothetical protein [unclassified Microcoleus]
MRICWFPHPPRRYSTLRTEIRLPGVESSTRLHSSRGEAIAPSAGMNAAES